MMQTQRFIACAAGQLLVGWLEDCSDRRTQGETLDELEENLRETCSELSSCRSRVCSRSVS
jgi:hypothetical protein